MLKNPAEMLIFMSIIVVLGFVVCSGGIKNGLEKVSKFMMLALLGLIVVLVINSLMLKGAGKGLEFFLSPDIERASQAGWANVITSAMTQAFFTLSIGIASMEIFGSYMSKDNTLPSESIRITALDTFVAVMSGLIIFPACFSFDVEPSQGPALIFMTLPKIFINMPFGRVWGTLFFLFMSFASFSTVTAVFESLISASIENFGLSRKKAAVINCVVMLAASLPCLLGFNVLSFVQLAGKNILDMEDFIVSNILLPVGALVFVAFCTSKYGWGFDKFLGESNTGKGFKFSPVLKNYFKFALPVMIILVLVSGFVG
jgi:NSS family neurotransmitter:Na+ symporter